MRVAILTDLPFLNERTMYLSEIDKRLCAKGIETEVFVIVNSGILRKIDSLSTGFIRMLKASTLLPSLGKFDLVHVQFTLPLGFILAIIKRVGLINIPIVVHTHGYDVFSVPEIGYGIRRKKIGCLFVNYTWKRADRILAVCDASRSIIEKDGINRSKIDLLYNGVDETLFKKTTASSLPDQLTNLRHDNDFLFLSVASLTPVKNHAKIMKAHLALVEKYRSRFKIKLILFGVRPDKGFVSIESSEDIVNFGKVPHQDMHMIYNIADAFLLGSISEAHPWSLLEAMSCELPVLASNVGGIPETVVDKRMLFNPFKVQEIQGKMETLLQTDKKEREGMGFLNRQRVVNNFTLDLHVRRLCEVYESLCTK